VIFCITVYAPLNVIGPSREEISGLTAFPTKTMATGTRLCPIERELKAAETRAFAKDNTITEAEEQDKGKKRRVEEKIKAGEAKRREKLDTPNVTS
jgi:hypothetical protein